MALGDAGARLLGGRSGDGAGGAVAGVGDVNGDGVDDVLIGATGEGTGGAGAGAAYLLWGAGG
jgi:hypothetical protein